MRLARVNRGWALKKIAKLLRNLKQDLRGNILVMVGAGTAAMVGSAGIAVDAVQWYLWKRSLQQSVDAGSIAGALSLSRGEDWEGAAKTAIIKSTNTGYTIEKLVNPPESGAYEDNPSAVEIIATTSRALPFSSVFMAEPATIRVRSVAIGTGEGEHCVISLKKSGVGLSTQGNATVNLGCGVVANSKSKDAVFLNGTSYLKANPINSHGGIVYDSSNIDSGTMVVPYGNEVEDPISKLGLEVPDPLPGCSYTKLKILPSNSMSIAGGATPSTATRFCGGIDLKGELELTGGFYIVSDGDLKVNSGATLTGDKVTLILTGSNSAKVADVDISGTAKVDLMATDDDTSKWDGVLIYQDPIGSTHTSKIAGGADLGLEGIVYLPGGDIEFTGNSGQKADCLFMVASTVTFSGTSTLDYDSSKCPFDTTTVETSSLIVRVVE